MSSQFGGGEDTPGVERGDGAAAEVDGSVEQFASARKVGGFEQCGGLAEEECGQIAIGGIRGAPPEALFISRNSPARAQTCASMLSFETARSIRVAASAC